MTDKLSYFPLYVDDFASSGKVEAMCTEGVGVYILLLCKAWREVPAGSLPDHDATLARWGRVSESRWQELKPAVMAAFTLGSDSRWHQPRMRSEHTKAVQLYKARRSGALKTAAAKRCSGSSASAERVLSTMPATACESVSVSNTLFNERSELTPEPLAEKPVLLFPIVGIPGLEWMLLQQKIDEYKQTFPDLDVLSECRKARQWCIDNKAKRKTAKGMPAFLNTWLGNAQNRGRGGGNSFAPSNRAKRPPTMMPDPNVKPYDPKSGDDPGEQVEIEF